MRTTKLEMETKQIIPFIGNICKAKKKKEFHKK